MKNEIRQFIGMHAIGILQCMNLYHFDVYIKYKKLGDHYMNVEVDYRYLDAVITIDEKRIVTDWNNDEKDKILETLCHECVHLITQEMSNPFHVKGEFEKPMTRIQIHFEERVTEHISRLILRLYLLENKIKL